MTTVRTKNIIRYTEFPEGTIGKLPRLLGRVDLDTTVSGSVEMDTDIGNVDCRESVTPLKESSSVKIFAVRDKASLVIECIFNKEENAFECCEMMNGMAGATATFEVATLKTED